MAQTEPSAIAAQLEADAQLRYVRWNADLWQQIVEGPARRLQAEQVPATVLESYLRLAAAGIGLGYLFPTTAAQNCFTLAWTRLIPERLTQLRPEQQPGVLAELWNLAENLEHSPVWLRHLCREQLASWPHLDDLEGMLARVNAEVLEPPAQTLTEGRLAWIHLADAYQRFLPGFLHFVAPTVVCVHDRNSRDASVAVWLRAESPRLLDPMTCGHPIGPTDVESRWNTTGDPRVTTVFSAASNRWRAAATLVTSQYLVAQLP